MFKQVNIVPAGIRYLGEGNWFRFDKYPNKCIINKQIPGCGFTEYSLTGPEFVILCSPRKLLLQNKKDQHGDRVYLVKNEMEKDLNVDVSIDKPSRGRLDIISKNDLLSKLADSSLDENSQVYRKIYYGLSNYLENCYRCSISPKILVTYDSYHLVVDILQRIDITLFAKFYTIVDEFQSILHDARFKSSTELSFMSQLKRSMKTLFVSATPMLDEYLEELDEFKDLNYYTLDWAREDITRVIKPDLQVSQMKSINSKSKEIIDSYLSGNFESVIVNKNGIPTKVVSDEAVFYVNSVNHILNIVKNNGLTPDQVNVLCADTEENRRKIWNRLTKKFNIGSIPLKGEKPKMFTFCTRTVYLGADFYSTCARSFIFSDSNSDCLAVDISEDLPQILGRQRLNENPWKNTAEFYYKTTADYRVMTEEDFKNIVDKKKEATGKKLKAFNEAISQDNKDTIADVYQQVTRLYNYKDDYVAVDEVMDFIPNEGVKIVKKPVWNNLVLVNEKRAFHIQQIDYKDRFTVFAAINKKFSNIQSDNEIGINKIVMDFMKIYEEKTTMTERLRLLCECGFDGDTINIILSQLVDSDSVKSYYLTLGPQKLKNLGYNITFIRKELGIVTFSPETLINTIYSNFHVGEKWLLSEIKQKLSELYTSISYKKTPKAIDILEYFEIKEYKVTDIVDGVKKRVRGYELIKSYELEMRTKLELINNS